jgi:Flp pilus assembly protein TadG
MTPADTTLTTRGDGDGEAGSLSVETVVVIPLVIVLLLFVVGVARLVHARSLIDQAADQAALAAALGPGTGPGAQARAVDAARTILAGSYNCTDPHVTLTVNQAADAVTAAVACTVPLKDLLTAGFPGHESLSASETAPRNLYAPAGTP